MQTNDELFARLQDVHELLGLVGQTEDLHLDCKTWPSKDDEAQRILAKTICGFANSEGGVIVIGLEARSNGDKYDADLIQRPVPVPEPLAVKTRIESLAGDLVEPRVNVSLAVVFNQGTASEGFVLVNVPSTDSLPCRTKKHREFYQRITSGTYPMEYFQLADMFGRRHRPILSFYLEEGEIRQEGNELSRSIIIGITNTGRALARFPSIRVKRTGASNMTLKGIDRRANTALPFLPTEPEMIAIAGGADHVIYPGSTLKITRVEQAARISEWQRPGGRRSFVFEAISIEAELCALGVANMTETKTISRKETLDRPV
jgi:hypothetical protein